MKEKDKESKERERKKRKENLLRWNWYLDYSFFCVQAVALFKSYFGGAFDEDAIRNNFVLIYELLDGT